MLASHRQCCLFAAGPPVDRYNYGYTRSSIRYSNKFAKQTWMQIGRRRRPAKINISQEIMEDTERTVRRGISDARTCPSLNRPRIRIHSYVDDVYLVGFYCQIVNTIKEAIDTSSRPPCIRIRAVCTISQMQMYRFSHDNLQFRRKIHAIA